MSAPSAEIVAGRETTSPAGSALLDVVVLSVAMIFPSIMTCLAFVVLPGMDLERNPLVQGLFAFGKVVQFSFPILYVWLVCKQRLGWGSFEALGVKVGIAFGLLVAAGTAILYFTWLKHTPLMEETAAKVSQWMTTMNLASPAGFFLLAGFVAILHSFLEEYYWRWFVFGRLRRYMPLGAAMALSSLAFMAHHVILLSVYMPGGWRFWAGVVPFSLCVAGGGVVWAWMFHRTRSIYGPWLSHLIVDAALMGLGLDMLAPVLFR